MDTEPGEYPQSPIVPAVPGYPPPPAYPVSPAPAYGGQPLTPQRLMPPRRRRSPSTVVTVLLTAVAVLGFTGAALVFTGVLPPRPAGTSGGATTPAATTGAPAAPAVPSTFTVVGSLSLTKLTGITVIDATHCTGKGGYDDIGEGAQVVVTDAAGTVVGVGKLDAGHPGGHVSGCEFDFTVPGVPRGKGFYGIEISHRGVLRYAEDRMLQRLYLELG